MDTRNEILERIDAEQDDEAPMLSELVRRPSENPPGDTREAAACVAEFLRAEGGRRWQRR
jgi:succinyl-diaminopimelate desuccinylase